MAISTKMTGFRVTKEEENRILSEMIAAGDEGISQHIKRVYFEAINGESTGTMSSMMEDIFLNIKYLREKENAKPDDGMMLQLLCGLYLMLRNSVGDGVKKEADQYVDAQQIEIFLKG